MDIKKIVIALQEIQNVLSTMSHAPFKNTVKIIDAITREFQGLVEFNVLLNEFRVYHKDYPTRISVDEALEAYMKELPPPPPPPALLTSTLALPDIDTTTADIMSFLYDSNLFKFLQYDLPKEVEIDLLCSPKNLPSLFTFLNAPLSNCVFLNATFKMPTPPSPRDIVACIPVKYKSLVIYGVSHPDVDSFNIIRLDGKPLTLHVAVELK